jgi:predicted Zn-dependent peptidase
MKRWQIAAAVPFTLSALICGAASAAKSGSGAAGLAALEKQVKEFRLDNGLTFLVLERPDAPVFSFRTYVDVGGVDEVAGITGIAHMFEHMAFKGTTHIGATEFEKEAAALARVEQAYNDLMAEKHKRYQADSTRIETLAKAFKDAQTEADRYVVSNEFSMVLEQEGVTELNAFTGVDATNYLYNLPSNKLELWAMLEGDRLTQPVLREFYKERDVVIEERRLGTESTPSGRLFEDFLTTSFSAHPYGNGIIGHRSDLESFTRTEAEEFYRKHYVAKNMTVAVVGDVKAAEVEALAKKYFSRVSDAPPPAPVETLEPPQRAERRVVMEDEAQPLVFVGYHIPDFNDPRFHDYDALSEVLGVGRSSRLYTSLVKEKQLAVQVGASTGMPGRKYPNLMFFYIVPAAGVDPEDALEALDAELQRLIDEAPATADEVNGYKSRTRADFLRTIQSNEGMAGQLATFQELGGDWRGLFRLLDRVERITPENVMGAARTALRKENRTVAILRQGARSES